MPAKNNIHHLLIRIFTGEATSKDKAVVNEWIKESEDNNKLYNDLRELWLTSGIDKNADQYNVQAAINKFKEKTINSQKKTRRIADLLKYAAILILLVAVPFSFYLGSKSTVDNSYTTIACAIGDKSNVTLPDGSLVWLNSGSELRFKNNFKDDYRMVHLSGEAYFSVSKDKKHPFKVNASEIVVEVLGTEFNLKAYSDEHEITTTLAEGSIYLKSKTQNTIMKPGQKIVYNKDNKTMNLFALSDLSPETGWKEGRLVFRDESLEELKPKLERWFDVDIEFADEVVKKSRFSGILEKESILEAIDYFDYSKYVGYKIKGNQITFYTE